MLHLEKIVRQKDVGRPIMVGNTLQRVLAVLSQDEGRTYLLSMTHILNKTQCLTQQWNVLTNGTVQDPDSVYNPVVEFCVVMTRWATDDLQEGSSNHNQKPKQISGTLLSFLQYFQTMNLFGQSIGVKKI